MTERLDENDVLAAAKQGWALEEVYDTRGYFVQVAVPTPSGSPFKSSHAASTYVLHRARKGDALSIRAMKLIAASRFTPPPPRRRK